MLGWIRAPKSSLKLFVLNRINEIAECTDPLSWRYIPTDMNPADIGSRGLNATQLKDSCLWWHGPKFLTQSESHWPKHPVSLKLDELPETKVLCHTLTSDNVNNFHKRNFKF